MPDAKPEKSENQLLGDRRNKLKRLRDEFGLDPYGQRTPGILNLADAAALYDEAADQARKADENSESESPVDDRPFVKVAGRVMQHRVMGNLIFMSLRDHTGDLQVAVSKKAVGQPYFGLAKMTDYGDLVCATGRLGTTNTGETTVWTMPQNEGDAPYAITTKSLALPPGKHHGLTDPETRYRKRYVDLYANPGVMETMQLRIRIIDEIRDYLRAKGFMEVETPMLQSLHGGAAARPFKTHHNALDLPLTLRIAPELYLKRLLVGGLPKVFEINRNFRNEGISPRHNPEFTMLEAYEAYGNWETMAELVEDMTCTIAEKLFGTLKIEHKNEDGEVTKTINLTRPWRRVSMADLVEERTGWKFDKEIGISSDQTSLITTAFANKSAERFVEKEKSLFDKPQIFHESKTSESSEDYLVRIVGESGVEKLRQEALRYFHNVKALSPAEQLVEIYEKLIEPTLIDPTFVTRVPSVIIPLAKKCVDDDYFADVYELAINGVEISPGYTELNDPAVQEANFREQVGDEEEQQQIDEDFLEALRVGMPPAGGMGLGVDRLVMMLTGAESIRDVILFPLMRPQEGK
ncbi:MAG: amino acid--tRNA ligase-related protein [Planctomycetota bacterium]